MDALTSASATSLAGLIARRELTAREAVEAHLRRIEAVNGQVNAVVQLDAERALAAADAADRALARGEPLGPLHGVPFTVKDTIAAAGIEMAMGAPERAGVVPPADATAVARIRAAGGILLGKTNCPAYGGGIETENPVYGRTSNPYDLARTPGGSSGGEAAIVAAQGSPCGLGTDSGASVRLPAHFCGLASIKPSAGRVPLTGVLDDEGQLGTLGDPRTQVGPLARSVDDVALLLRIVAGPDGHDGGVAPVAARAIRATSSCAGCASRCRPRTASTPHAGDGRGGRGGGGSARARPAPRSRRRAIRTAGTSCTIEVWRSYGEGVAAAELWRLLRRWDGFRSRMLAFAARYDLLVCPVFAGPGSPARHDERPGRARPDELDDAAQPDRLAGGDRARRDLARGVADRRAARRRGRGATTSRSPPRCGWSGSWAVAAAAALTRGAERSGADSAERAVGRQAPAGVGPP